MSRSKVLGTALGATTLALSMTLSAQATVPTTEFSDLDGLPLTSITAPGSAVGHGPDGEPWLYLVSSGSPSALSVIDARTGERVDDFALPGAGGSWAVTVTPNGDVYVGSYGEGHLFRWTPGEDDVEDLGAPVPGETFIWAVASDHEGRIYGGTGQNDGHIFRFDPETEAITDFGPVSDVTDPLMVRAIATSDDGLVYGLTGMDPSLWELDPESGAYTELGLPPSADPEVSGYDLDVRGELLFARFTDSGPPSPLHVMDLATGEWIQEIPDTHGLHLSEMASDGRTVYFVRDSELWSYDVLDQTYEATGVAELTDRRGFGFLELEEDDWPGETLVGLDYTGRYHLYSPQTGASEFRQADAVAAPASIRSIAEGPDGKVYAGSYLAGGLASYDPETGEKAGFAPEIGQAEGMAVHDGMLYIGTYPGADIMRYDPNQPAVRGKNPEPVIRLYDDHDQSRPYAMISAGPYLAVGTVPANGVRGGGVTLVDTQTGSYTFFDEIVPGHSVVGLAFLDGVLYGSTSVYSGVGGPRPDETDAAVFALDVESRDVVWQERPLPGEGAFGQLAFDAEGVLWTHSPTTVVGLDRETGETLDSKSYDRFPWDTIDYAHVATRMWVDPYTELIANVTQGSMWVIDPETLERARHVRPVSHGFLHNNGTSYLARDTNFYSHRFLDDRGSPTVTIGAASVPTNGEQTVELSGFGPGELVELWSQPDGRLIETLNVDENGNAEVSFTAVASAGEARVAVTRAQTGNQILASYIVRTADPAEAVAALRSSLETHIDSGHVGGPIAHQLTNTIDQVQRHLDGDRQKPAVGALERFIGHLDNSKQPDTLDAAVKEELRSQAMEILNDI